MMRIKERANVQKINDNNNHVSQSNHVMMEWTSIDELVLICLFIYLFYRIRGKKERLPKKSILCRDVCKNMVSVLGSGAETLMVCKLYLHHIIK